MKSMFPDFDPDALTPMAPFEQLPETAFGYPGPNAFGHNTTSSALSPRYPVSFLLPRRAENC